MFRTSQTALLTQGAQLWYDIAATELVRDYLLQWLCHHQRLCWCSSVKQDSGVTVPWYVAILCLPFPPLPINPTKYELNLKIRTVTHSSIKPQMTSLFVKGVLNLSICYNHPRFIFLIMLNHVLWCFCSSTYSQINLLVVFIYFFFVFSFLYPFTMWVSFVRGVYVWDSASSSRCCLWWYGYLGEQAAL